MLQPGAGYFGFSRKNRSAPPFLAHRMSVVNGLGVLSFDLLVIGLISCNSGTYRDIDHVRVTLSDIDVGWFS